MKEQIEKLREKLNDLIVKRDNLTHYEVIKLSKELDNLIYNFYLNPAQL